MSMKCELNILDKSVLSALTFYLSVTRFSRSIGAVIIKVIRMWL